MTEFITDLEEIQRIAKRQREANYGFRAYLKVDLEWSDKRLDALVHEILERVTEDIDCTECGNCCIEMTPSLDTRDINRLARRLAMSHEAFVSVYLSRTEFGEQAMAQAPCPFLEGKRCTVYEDRPKDCRSFPHLHKSNIRSRSIGLIENAEICPIVFNTLQLLKLELGWRPKASPF